MGTLKNKLGSPLRKILHMAGYSLSKRNLPSNLPPDYSDFERKLYLDVSSYTMTPSERIISLARSVEYVVEREIPGALVECGVWRGGSMMAVAKTLMRLGRPDRDLYLFDTYEGMTAPSTFDVSYTGVTASDVLARDEKWCFASLEDVRANLVKTGYPESRLHFVKGRVEETLPDQAPDQIALLRLDTDFYESTCHELKTLYPRLVSTGVLVLDDYGEWLGVRKACDEYFSSSGHSILLNRIDFSARIGVKL